MNFEIFIKTFNLWEMTTDINELNEFTVEAMEVINEVAKGIIKKYKLKIPNVKTVFSTTFNNGHVSSIRDKTLVYKRANALLNNKDKIEEYFNKNPTAGISSDDFINYMILFKEIAKPKEITEKEEAERQKEEATERAERAESEKEKIRQEKEETEQALKDSRETGHKRMADKTNENKELIEENERLKKILKEIEKAPLKRKYINDKVFNESYSLDKGELMDVISKDINKGNLPENSDPEEIADAIYAKATKRIYKNLKRINNLTALTGYNPDLYNKLPPEVAEIIKNHINEKMKDDIRRKNIKYILPKDKPRWEHAMESKKLNPMLGRSAWRVN